MSIIRIFLNINTEGKLHLTDSEGHEGEDRLTTTAHPGDCIVWQIAENKKPGLPNIVSIDKIAAKKDSVNIFVSGPEKISDDEWRGTVNEKSNQDEAYDITYTLSNGKTITDDPDIKVKPIGPGK